MSNETISLGSCKTCGAPAQFLDDGTTRYVDVKQDEIDRLRAELEQERERVRELEDALEPFSHPDLRERIGGQMYGDSPVYGRNNATLYINDFERANEVLANSEKEGK